MIVTIEETNDGSGDCFIPISQDILEKLGLNIGDTIKWSPNDDGSFTLTKSTPGPTTFHIETISTFSHTYIVTVPDDDITQAWADILSGTAEEVCQESLGERIVSNWTVQK